MSVGLPVLLEEICRLILGIYKLLKERHMNLEIGAEAALFPEKEYINGIAVTVWGGGEEIVSGTGPKTRLLISSGFLY